MKKTVTLILAALLILTISLTGCNNKDDDNDTLLTLCELPESQEKEIGNQIPKWVSDANWALPLSVMTSTDLDKFNDYARRIFPSYYDDGWTQEQSDQVYLGQGIEMYALDDTVPECRIVYYPVILNGVVVSGLEVYEDLDSHDLGWQAGPHLANPLNALMQQMAMFDTESVLLLGYNYNNTIGIIGNFGGSNVGTIWNNYYILDTDHVEHKEVDTRVIPIKEITGGVVDAMEPLCTERTETITDEATSCLELTLASGEIVRLSVATDSCPNFGINGVYY